MDAPHFLSFPPNFLLHRLFFVLHFDVGGGVSPCPPALATPLPEHLRHIECGHNMITYLYFLCTDVNL